MKMRKRLIAISLVLGMTAGLAACGNKTNQNGEQNFFLKLSHYRAEGSVADVDINKFADEVNAADDSLEVWVYPAAQLGDYTTVQELVSIGDVEMQFATLGTSVDKYLGITSAPYICSNWDDAYKIFNRDSEFTATIADHLADQNIKLLSVYPLYFGGAIMNKEVDDPASMKNQGIKVRCQTMKGPELVTTMLGYIATPMALNDCFTSLQTGVIDGMIGSGAEGYYSSYRDVAKYYLPYNDHFEVWYLYINMDKWNEMSKKQQEVLQTAANHLEDERWKEAPTQTEEYEQKLEDYGVQIINFTYIEYSVFITALICKLNIFDIKFIQRQFHIASSQSSFLSSSDFQCPFRNRQVNQLKIIFCFVIPPLINWNLPNLIQSFRISNSLFNQNLGFRIHTASAF